MTTHVFSTSYHSAFGNGISLADEEFLYVAAGATLSSGVANAIWGGGDYHLINIYGNAVGDRSGIWLEGSGNLIRLHEGAQVHGGNVSGVTLEGYSQRLDNSGAIHGGFTASSSTRRVTATAVRSSTRERSKVTALASVTPPTRRPDPTIRSR